MEILSIQHREEVSLMDQDEQDYRAFLHGDQTGFERLVLRYKDGLIHFIYRFVYDVHQAEDLSQDVFVEVLLHPERYRSGTSFKTYIYTIGHHRAVDYVRKQAHVTYVEDFSQDISLQQDTLLLEEKIIRDEKKKELYHCMKQLKPEYERVLYLIDLEGLSYEEAARVLEKSQGQVKVLIHRARKKLRQRMEEMQVML